LTDVVGYRFWRYAYPKQFKFRPDINQLENFREIINDAYIYADRVIGEILEMAPKDVTVIILSDHGMHAINKQGRFAVTGKPLDTNSGGHMDAPPGVFIAAGPGIKGPAGAAGGTPDLSSIGTVGGMTDVLPTILVLRDIPIGEDMDGSPMRGILDFEAVGETAITYIPTHDTETWLAGRNKRIRDAIDQTERLEQLRSLGYIK
jgi:hypothetical protein